MSLDAGHYGDGVAGLFTKFWRQIGLALLVFAASFAIAMIVMAEPTTQLLVRHRIKNGVQYTERWCRSSSLWGETETLQVTLPDGSKSC